MLPKLFDFFEQENVSGTDGNTGLGIGLALTRSLLAKHPGGVFATSAGPGCGVVRGGGGVIGVLVGNELSGWRQRE